MSKLDDVQGDIQLKVTDPPDFYEGGKEYRRNILVSTSVILILLTSTTLEPKIFSISVSAHVMWFCLAIAHIYFFIMWRLTSPIEGDRNNHFWNLRGLYKQALLGGTKNFPGKTKAQLLFIRALPIWAFVFGIVGIVYGFTCKLA